MPYTRRAKAKITMDGADVSARVISFTYTDNYDRTDVIKLTLSDKDMQLVQALPDTGGEIQAAIELSDWNGTGDNRTKDLGTFEIDEIGYDGTISISAVATIKRGCSDIINEPRFRRNAKNVYKACEISHFDPKTDKLYTGYFEAPNVGDVGHTLQLREHFNSESDDMELDRKAKARCREMNKWEWVCDLKLKGDTIYFSGTNIELEGWRIFDGKYHIAKATHTIGSGGYTCSLSIRRCLEGY